MFSEFAMNVIMPDFLKICNVFFFVVLFFLSEKESQDDVEGKENLGYNQNYNYWISFAWKFLSRAI